MQLAGLGQAPARREEPGPQRHIEPGERGLKLLEPAPPLADQAAQTPEGREGDNQLSREGRLIGCEAPVEGGVEIALGAHQRREGVPLVGSAQLGARRLAEGEEVGHVPATHGGDVRQGLEALLRVLAHEDQEREALVAALIRLALDKVLVHKRPELQHQAGVRRRRCGPPADRRRGLDGPLALYVAGDFERAGQVAAVGIARWNIPTATWHPVGSGEGPGDGSSAGTISTVAVVEGEVFVGGTFDAVDGVPAYRVARWDGARWSPLAGGVFNESLAGFEDVSAMVGVGDRVYVGGQFEFAENPGGVPDVRVNNLAVWSRSAGRWSAVGGGVSGSGSFVGALALEGETLYAGGRFTQAGGVPVNNLARWSAGGWSDVAGGVAGVVDALRVRAGQLYVAGSFDGAGAVARTESLARWDGSRWQSLGSDLLLSDPSEDRISAVDRLPDGRVFVAGAFGDSGTPLVNNLAIWDGTGWRGTGMGLEDGSTAFVGSDSFAVAVSPAGQVFVGRRFTTIGGQPFSRLAMWDGERWQSIGGADGAVNALLVRGDNLYVGGSFTQVGGNLPAARVAVYNMRSGVWSALGNGLPGGVVTALAFVGDTLYAGGRGFPSETECCLWKWNGAAWAPFSQRLRSVPFFGPFAAETSVQALASDGQVLLVGGEFLNLELRGGDQRFEANDLFLYDPAADTAAIFGAGADNGDLPANVSALALAADGLYVGGSFTTIDRVPAANIARLTSAGWGPVGGGVLGDDAGVSAFAVNGRELFVGGRFETAGVEAFNIARWDTARQRWSALGCGIARNGNSVSTGRVTDLAVQPAGLPNAGLFVAGGIAEAGCVPSMGFAIWYGVGPSSGLPPPPAGFNNRLLLPIVRR